MAERTSARKASGTPAIRFEAHVHGTGGSTILRLPDDASEKLPSRGLLVRIKGSEIAIGRDVARKIMVSRVA